MKSTIKVGTYTIQEHNMIVPDGAKIWVVKNAQHGAVYSSRTKAEAVAWAENHTNPKL